MALLTSVLRPIPGALFRELRSLSLREPKAFESLKPVLSVLVAVGTAAVLNLDDLSWAAFSGYMVMRGDVRETAPRGLNRIAGTVSGALLGLLLAPVVADSPALLCAGLFAVSWIGTFGSLTSKYSYAWLFFGLTAGLVMTEALASPQSVVHFAATRVADIVVGTASCMIVASLFSHAAAPVGGGQSPQVPPLDQTPAFSDEWLSTHKPLLVHSTRVALGVGLLPLIWRWFSIEDFFQTAVTSYVVMNVPAAVVRERRHQTIYERMAHRTFGCLLGGATAVASIALFGDALLPWLLALSAGVWVGYHIQIGRHGIGYLGTQFSVGLLIVLVQGPGPATSVMPGLERLLGILIGSVMACALILIWPLPDDA